MNQLLQIWLFITSAVSIYFLAHPVRSRHYIGCWIGIAGQPAWFYSSFQNAQWGIFLLAAWFAINYARGILRHRRDHLKAAQ